MREREDVSLETPLLIHVAAGVLGLTAALMTMMAVQFTLNLQEARGPVFYLTVAYAVAGVTGLVMAGAAAQGKTWGVIGGLVMSLLILGLSWTPYLFLVFAATSVCSGFFALASLLLLGVSLPQCIRLNKDRAAFQREIDQT